MLPQILLVFDVEIFTPFHFMQLARIVLDGREPLSQTLFEARLRRCGYGATKGLDGGVMAHGIALHQAAYSTYVKGLAVGPCAGDGKSHLAPPDRGEVRLQREPSRQAIRKRIREVDERAPGFQRDCIERDAVVARAERPRVRVQPHLLPCPACG